MTRNSRTSIPLVAAAAALAATLSACERPTGQVIPPAVENYSRNLAQAKAPADELPRDADAAARQPTAPALASRAAISDTLITARIKAALLSDPGMTGADVSVNTEHGIVILAGSVKSYEQAGVASAHAQSQDGVMRVDNQLSLTPQ